MIMCILLKYCSTYIDTPSKKYNLGVCLKTKIPIIMVYWIKTRARQNSSQKQIFPIMELYGVK